MSHREKTSGTRRHWVLATVCCLCSFAATLGVQIPTSAAGATSSLDQDQPGDGGLIVWLEIPYPELDSAEPEVRRQLEGQRRRLETALESETPSEELAALFGATGELYQAYDLAEAALAAYRNAHGLDPARARWLHLLGIVQRMQGDLEAAAESFRGVLALEDGRRPEENLATHLHLAAVELELDQPAAAEKHARAALALEPSSAAALSSVGRALARGGDLAGAINSYERALELAPGARRLHYLAGQAHRRAGDIESARRHLEKQGPGEPSFADRRLASIYTGLEGSAAWMQRAAKAEVAGQLEASIELYRLAVEKAPRSPEARRDLGALLARSGRYEEAVEEYREAVSLEPERGLNHFVLGLVLESTGQSGAALKSMRHAVERDPTYREFRRVLAMRLMNLGDLGEAQRQWEALIELDRTDQEARLERAKILLERRDFEAVSNEVDGILGADPPGAIRAQALVVAGAAAARGGQAGRAIEYLESALAIDPTLAAAYFELATVAGIAGDFDAAARHYRQVTELEPGRTASWLGESTALALAGREAEAVARLELAVAEPETDRKTLVFALARLLVSAQNSAARNGPRAVELAEELVRGERTARNADLLIAAFATAGRFADAAAVQRELLDAMPEGFDPELRESWTQRLSQLEGAASQSPQSP